MQWKQHLSQDKQERQNGLPYNGSNHYQQLWFLLLLHPLILSSLLFDQRVQSGHKTTLVKIYLVP